MTSPAAKKPTSNPILLATLKWGGLVSVGMIVLGALIGFLVAGDDGMWSALAGVLISAVFLAITAASILFANRWYGDPLYVPVFFGIVLGGWIVKFIIFIVLMLVLREQPWVHPTIFFLAVVAGVLGGLVVDVLVMLKMRLPYVSDVTLPGEEDTPASDS